MVTDCIFISKTPEFWIFRSGDQMSASNSVYFPVCVLQFTIEAIPMLIYAVNEEIVSYPCD